MTCSDVCFQFNSFCQLDDVVVIFKSFNSGLQLGGSFYGCGDGAISGGRVAGNRSTVNDDGTCSLVGLYFVCGYVTRNRSGIDGGIAAQSRDITVDGGALSDGEVCCRSSFEINQDAKQIVIGECNGGVSDVGGA